MAAPQDARPLFRLGNALFAIQQFHDSQEAFSQALSYASLPGDAALLPKIHVNLGISLEAEGQLELACQHYRCCLCAAINFHVHDATAATFINLMRNPHFLSHIPVCLDSLQALSVVVYYVVEQQEHVNMLHAM